MRKDNKRVLSPNRTQLRLMPLDLDRMVREGDPVRAVWEFVERVDLSDFYEKIRAVEGSPGRSAIDPKILMALWLFGTIEGIGSAREIARLCETDWRYQWICGGVTPGYHVLSDFRSLSEKEFDRILTNTVAVLMDKDLVTLERVAQDGMKVRASAGSGSFHTKGGLEECREIARQQVEDLKQELERDGAAGTRRRDAARLRAARDRSQRIEEALAELPEIEERKKSNNGKKKSEARSSTTDPEARVMKMADGGFRPALNVHFVTDTRSKVVAAVEVNNHGTDQRMTVPLAEQIDKRFGKNPMEWLEDGGCVTLAGIDSLSERGTHVIAPVRPPRALERDATEVRPTDSEAVADWRTRMATEYAKTAYKERGATAELANAHARAHGLTRFLVRSINKARSVALLLAIANNMRREWSLA
mgnify:CR=1 FL=1